MNFDLNNTPLEKGASLIEASAGTGKTYTIAGLFVRLLLEEELALQEILVVTYTNAATEELRSRIRAVLSEALKTFATGQSKNPFLQKLFERHQSRKEKILERLDRALCSFDEAAIYSIHGFCQRMLKDRAFESGALFDMELAADVSTLLQEIADDYWRKNFYSGNSIQASYALKNGFAPERFLPWLQSNLNYPFIRFLSAVDQKPLPSLIAELEANFEKAKEIWQSRKAEIKQLFGSHQKKAWANTPYNNDEKVADFFLRLEKCFASTGTIADLDCLEIFCNAALLKGTGKDKMPPRHPFFTACDAICHSEAAFITALQIDFIQFALRELPLRKDQLKIQSFDDLLTRLQQALRSTGGARLAKAVGKRFRAALIDEFQDTDPIQYEIFHTIFFGNEHYLFLIGDPKQAIYGFRGADIFTYLKAAKQAARKFTLGENWRSESGLVQAVNGIFSKVENPFVFSGIEFEAVQARGEANKTPLRINGKQQSPFELWFWPRGDDGKAVSKEKAESELPSIVAAEISRLLSGDVRIGDRRIRPEDIAILVMENRQAQMMQEALNALGIPSVQQTTASLFESLEAEELHCLLLALSQPSNERLVKAALSTAFFGTAANEIELFTEENPQWQKRLESFHEYSRLWSRNGFIQMFRDLLRRETVRARLLALPEGERRLTNVLHLGEVLHQAVIEHRLGVSGLIKWLAQQCTGKGLRNEEYQLRLERDENAVKLVTVHRSKGLEYGIVFCPFSWKHSELTRGGTEEVLFHDRATSELFRDLGSAAYEENRKLALEEKLAENLRLLYVALTRAKHRCYFVWGHFNKAATSAPAWLFHGQQLQTIEQKSFAFKTMSDDAMLTDLRGFGAAAPSPICISNVPTEAGTAYSPEQQEKPRLLCPALHGLIKDDWRVTSFSSLTEFIGDEAPDYDEPENSIQGTQSVICTFPKGTRPGTCLHEILENWNFNETKEEPLNNLVARKLREHGLSEEEFTRPVSQMVRNVLSVSLDGKDNQFKLSKLRPNQRLSEMEFYFPLKKISPRLLHNMFVRQNLFPDGNLPTKVGRLHFDPVAGYMKGFIDLVFQMNEKYYVLDWKSNWLGDSIEHYDQTAIGAAMLAKNYHLQSRIYSLALHQYLKQRLPDYNYEKHFGGTFYVFLRGIDPKRPQFGIFRDYLTAPLMEDMAEQLIRA